MGLHFTRFQGRPDLRPQINRLTDEVWPTFMHQDPIGNRYWSRLFDDNAHLQVVLLEDETVIGVGNTVALSWHQDLEALPETGWDWALETAMTQADQNVAPNALCGLQVAIAATHQGRRLSGEFIQQFRSLALAHKIPRILIPVRPTLKHRYPLTPAETYTAWTTPEGLPFDPWLRVHVKMGGHIVKVCSQSMTIPGTVADWESWTNMRFPESGKYVVPFALAPIQIDCEANAGTYIEPNVWVVHPVS